MATLAQAKAAVRARFDAGFTAIPVRYQREDTILPDQPEPFVFVEFDLDPPEYAGFGNGRGGNLQRVTGEILAHVLVPVGWGDADADGWGEQIAALFRSYRDDTISCFAAEPLPMTGKTEDGSYAHAVTVVIDIQYDKVG
jgi:hypothetical protein